ncbi:hypothetical protein CesoFtcFv8_008515 [Champsocephalus esox]|uniref:MICAL-like protein 2 n=1 Tax=Champsocephalus esox TaxID=159716 RepID=A0AAN8C8M1_9TELE|nr:hypothetical protein CesoFtcFv8_008515 [Champsocephalus esox]
MSAVKALQQWCRVRCDGYRDVTITNMTTSFRSGMAFCALIHKHRPDLINFDSLNKEDVYENNKLAFRVAEELGIPALLDADDMVALKVPDRLSILTYVSQYYNFFHGRSPIGGMAGIKRPADGPSGGPSGEPSGKKNQPVAAKVFPSSKPARENSPPPSANITRPSSSPRQTRNTTKDVVVEKPHQTSTLSNKCASCNQHVHLVQRHLVDGKLYHRHCAKAMSPSNPTAAFRDNTRPVAAPRKSTTAAKTLKSKLNFFKSESPPTEEERKTVTTSIVINKGPTASDTVQEKASAAQAVTVVVNVGGLGKKANVSWDTEETSKAVSGGEDSKTKAAAAIISKKLTEENNNNSKAAWTNVALKKTDKPPQVETPKKDPEPVRARRRLKADPSILADLQIPKDPSPVRTRTPERPASKPRSASPSASENSDSPSDWRSKLKPVSKPAAPSQPSKPLANGAGKPQTSDSSPSSHLSTTSISVTPPAEKGFLNGKGQTTNGNKPESVITKKKPDYIQKEDIIKELQDIEDNLNEWEGRGVELELRLRSSEADGEDDAVSDELMIEWFNLIRNKQVAMRRESELVYIGKTQDLEEEQPSVEQELRSLMEKPEHLKTFRDKKREEQLMAKLVEIVNDRNAIIEGLDEDRLREDEEDEELDKMMMTFNVKKDKPKKKSPITKLFGWGSKKEG